MSSESRRWRTGLLAACTVAAIGVFFVAFQGTPMMPWSSTTLGFAVDYGARTASATVTSVEPGGPADRAHVRAGDTINFRDIPFRERWRLRDAVKGYGGLAGEHLRYVVRRDGRTLIAQLTPSRVAPTWPGWDAWLAIGAAFWSLLFAVILAARRPDLIETRMLVPILLCMVGFNALTGLYAPWPVVELVVHTLSATLYLAGAAVLLTILASRFARPLSLTRRLLTFLSVAGAVGFAIQNLSWYLLTFVFGFSVYSPDLANVSIVVALLGSLACVVTAAVASVGAQRARLFWITVSLAPLWLSYALTSLIVILDPNYYPRIIVIELALLLMPIGLTYGILSRRIVDIGYVINRAAVFGAISLLIVCIFLIVEASLNAWATGIGRTANIVVNVAVALGLGLSMRFIHFRVDSVVDRLFFRQRYEDEAALRRFAHEAAFIGDPHELLKRTVKVVEERTKAASVEILLQDGGREYRSAGSNGAAQVVDEDDPAVLAIRSWHEPVDLRRYDTALSGDRAFPMTARGRVLGILVCGPKTGGETYAPDESDAVEAVAQGVGHSLEALKLYRAARPLAPDSEAILIGMQEDIRSILRELRAHLDRSTGHRASVADE